MKKLFIIYSLLFIISVLGASFIFRNGNFFVKLNPNLSYKDSSQDKLDDKDGGKSETSTLNLENDSSEEKDINKENDSSKNQAEKETESNRSEKGSSNEKQISSKPIENISKLSTTEKDWYYIPKKDGKVSGIPQDAKDLIDKYSGYYVGDISKKYIYLTFDEGYENGYTAKILDILKQHNIKAAFFVTTPYVNENKELVKRMVREGHLVANHTTKHLSMASIKDEAKFNKELIDCEKAFENLTGKKMPKYFRPPMGKYSELSLYYTQKSGYRSIFWSFAYADWDPENQPTQDYAKNIIMERTHGGGIYLLHAVSKTNTEILDWLIKQWKSKGYEFKTLDDL